MILLPPSNNQQVGDAYTSGDATKLIPTSVIPPELVKAIATEIITVITSASLTPSEKDTEQLKKAISIIIQNDTYIKYMYSNLVDFCGSVNTTLDTKDFTQFKKTLIKFFQTSSALASSKQAGTIQVGDTLKIDNGVLNIKQSAAVKLSTINVATNPWIITNINVNKPVYIKKECTDKDGIAIMSEISGMVSPCTVPKEIYDHRLIIPTGIKIELNVVDIQNCNVTAYQY